MPSCRIGTSGWFYDHWYGKFYPEELKKSDMLGFYIKNFDTVEINMTFYHTPTEKILNSWKSRSPEDFLFSVKANRWITHQKKLRDVDKDVSSFLSRINVLGDKLAAILFQLPGSIKKDNELIESFLSILPKEFRYAIEFRDNSWNNDDVFNILKKYNTAYCIISAPKMQTITELTADFVYIRLHGIDSWYSYRYTKQDIKWWADRIREFLDEKLNVYVYFNNDYNAFAVENARELRELVKL